MTSEACELGARVGVPEAHRGVFAHLLRRKESFLAGQKPRRDEVAVVPERADEHAPVSAVEDRHGPIAARQQAPTVAAELEARDGFVVPSDFPSRMKLSLPGLHSMVAVCHPVYGVWVTALINLCRAP